MVELGDDFDDIADDGGFDPLLPPEDRLWRHPSELGAHSSQLSLDALTARRNWMAATPSRAGAWSAGIVGALLATSVVLIGGHLTHLLSPATPRQAPAHVAAVEMTPTTMSMGLDPGMEKVASRITTAMPLVLDGTSSGVGIVVNSKGFILVPASLVADPEDISVETDGQQLIASLVGVDSGTGLAVVRVHDPEALTAAHFASGTSVGHDSFVALVWVGSDGPHSCWGTVRELDVQLAENGDSPPLLESVETIDSTSGVATGGVIIDGTGSPIGIVTSVTGKTLVATPGWLAEIVANDIISNGRVVHGWLGITGETNSWSASRTAVRVTSVNPGGAAAKAGVKPGDLIQSVDGKPVTTMSGIVATLYSLTPNQTIDLVIERDGHVWCAHVRLAATASGSSSCTPGRTTPCPGSSGPA
ncbi:MAG: S1C family serine protease [Acidimicrobiales bacterium]